MLNCCCFATILALSLTTGLTGQNDQTIAVDGRSMRVRTLGVSDVGRRPVVVFESGAGTGMNAWSAVLQDVSAFATVVASDRAGIGGSDDDGRPPTPRHVAQTLHAVLASTAMKPPLRSRRPLMGRTTDPHVCRLVPGGRSGTDLRRLY